IPAVELLQEAGRAPLAELSHRLADEEHELGHYLLPRRLGRVSVDDLAQRPRVSLRTAPDHDRRGAGRRQDRLRPCTRRHVARRGSSSSVAPAPVFVTLLTGHPKLMSTRSAPAASTIRAASAMTVGSEPNIWIASGCSSVATRR